MTDNVRFRVLLVGLYLCVMQAPEDQPDGPRLYVANQQPATISVIDIETNTVMHTIDLQQLGFTANAKPHHIAVEQDGSYWYVSLIADGKVLKFDRDNRLVGQVDFETPGMLALHPTEDLLYVGRSMAAVNPPERIGVIRRSDMSIEEIGVFFPRPHALVVDPRGDYVYTASLAVNQIASVHIETEDLKLTDVDGPPHVFVQFAISPDGSRMVASGQLTGKLLVFDTADPADIRLLHVVDVDAWPWHPTFTPDGRFVYVGNQESNTVSVINAEGWVVTEVITGEGLAQPHGIAVSPDGRYVYVSNHNLRGTYAASGDEDEVGTVVVIDTATHEIVKIIEVDVYAAGMSAPPAN